MRNLKCIPLQKMLRKRTFGWTAVSDLIRQAVKVLHMQRMNTACSPLSALHTRFPPLAYQYVLLNRILLPRKALPKVLIPLIESNALLKCITGSTFTGLRQTRTINYDDPPGLDLGN